MLAEDLIASLGPAWSCKNLQEVDKAFSERDLLTLERFHPRVQTAFLNSSDFEHASGLTPHKELCAVDTLQLSRSATGQWRDVLFHVVDTIEELPPNANRATLKETCK
eukprot:scaffold1621_cov150-Pinguiococcus_pyrenoidosus.AAC.10